MPHRYSVLRSLLSIVILGMLASPALAADLTIAGTLDLYAGSLQDAGSEGRTEALNSGGLTTSWIGINGSEDLDDGLKVGFKLSSFIRADTGEVGRFDGDTNFSRDANVYVSGILGTVSLGRDIAPNFLPTILFNPFGDSFTFSPLLLHGQIPLFSDPGWTNSIASDTGWSNQIRYTSPTFWDGVTVNLHYQFGEKSDDSGHNNVGANMLYNSGPLSLTAFYQNVKVNNPTDTPGMPLLTFATGPVFAQRVWYAGGAYDFKVVKLFLTYDQTHNDNPLEDKTATIGASIPMGSGKILASFAQTRRDAAGFSGVRRNTGAIGYDHDLSKNTDLYMVYMNDRLTGFDNGNSYAIGIRHRFDKPIS